MKKLTAYIDGQIVRTTPQMLEAFAPGRFKARGVFETMLAVGNQVFDVKAHTARMRQGLKQMGIQPPVLSPALIQRVVSANGFALSRVRLMVWQEGKAVHTALMAFNYQASRKKTWRICVIKTNRPAHARGANIKSLDYALFAESYAQAQAQGFDDAVLLNAKGKVFEASRANIFWVKQGCLHTPPLSSGCLNGITRQMVIQQARRLNIPFKEQHTTQQDLKSAKSAFLTNALIGIIPIDLSASSF